MTDAELIAALQKAIAFWLPRVPDEDSELEERLAHDAYLLFGYAGENEPSAEDRGWISLISAYNDSPAGEYRQRGWSQTGTLRFNEWRCMARKGWK